jgi:hypothetical protein
MVSAGCYSARRDRSFALRAISEAQAYLEADKHVGEVVVRI